MIYICVLNAKLPCARMFKSLYLHQRLFWILALLVCTLIVGYFFAVVFVLAKFALLLLGVAVLVDFVLLYRSKSALVANRQVQERFSNGDDNPVHIELENRYFFPLTCSVIDELPFQFQQRDFVFHTEVPARSRKQYHFSLRPTQRGEFGFGVMNVFVSSPLRLLKRRYIFDLQKTIAVYPSYIQMKKYELMAISQRLSDYGLKKMRRLGHTTEFEQIKPYVAGDDYRTVNWKATARTSQLMVNQYSDEKSQNVYCFIDKSRNMKMPFKGLSLLDYAINTSLVMTNIALHKQDKAGLITFCERIHQVLPADNKIRQMNLILETLYNQTTQFFEADYERLYVFVKRKLTQRSLIILFTNFESVSSLQRQLPFLRKIAANHVLVVVFFENTELKSLMEKRPKNTEEIYIKAIAENFSYEKKLIVKELEQVGIHTVLAPPEHISVNTINKYLELKARGKM